MKNQKYVMALLLCALIWGTAFVSQSTGGDVVGPFSFNAIRFLIGGGMLQCLLPILDRMGLSHAPGPEKEKKTLLLGGVLCGIMLCVGANFQQMGITLGTEVGRAGFLTSCYILLVPILGMFFHKKVPWNVWLGVVLCLGGLYLLCMPKGGFTMRLSDLLVVLCAVGFSIQIMFVDYFAPQVDGGRLSSLEFFVCGLGSFLLALPTEILSEEGIGAWLSNFASFDAWGSILYAGVMSSGIAYTLQVIGQQKVEPTVASLLMSLESLFALIAGWILLGERLSLRSMIGGTFIFAAVLLAQMRLEGVSVKKHLDKTTET